MTGMSCTAELRRALLPGCFSFGRSIDYADEDVTIMQVVHRPNIQAASGLDRRGFIPMGNITRAPHPILGSITEEFSTPSNRSIAKEEEVANTRSSVDSGVKGLGLSEGKNSVTADLGFASHAYDPVNGIATVNGGAVGGDSPSPQPFGPAWPDIPAADQSVPPMLVQSKDFGAVIPVHKLPYTPQQRDRVSSQGSARGPGPVPKAEDMLSTHNSKMSPGANNVASYLLVEEDYAALTTPNKPKDLQPTKPKDLQPTKPRSIHVKRLGADFSPTGVEYDIVPGSPKMTSMMTAAVGPVIPGLQVEDNLSASPTMLNTSISPAHKSPSLATLAVDKTSGGGHISINLSLISSTESQSSRRSPQPRVITPVAVISPKKCPVKMLLNSAGTHLLKDASLDLQPEIEPVRVVSSRSIAQDMVAQDMVTQVHEGRIWEESQQGTARGGRVSSRKNSSRLNNSRGLGGHRMHTMDMDGIDTGKRLDRADGLGSEGESSDKVGHLFLCPPGLEGSWCEYVMFDSDDLWSKEAYLLNGIDPACTYVWIGGTFEGCDVSCAEACKTFALEAVHAFKVSGSAKGPTGKISVVCEGKEPDSFWDYFVLG